MFKLLAEPCEDELLGAPVCLRDEWSDNFLKRYQNSEGSLRSEEALAFLAKVLDKVPESARQCVDLKKTEAKMTSCLVQSPNATSQKPSRGGSGRRGSSLVGRACVGLLCLNGDPAQGERCGG